VPYKQITQLPDNVKNNLPKHAQEISRRPSTLQRISTEKRTAPTGWPGAPWRTNTRRTIRATGSRRIANTLTRSQNR
jgi:hypothetical protein